MATESIDRCPICSNTEFEPFLFCTDFTTSHETFELQKCSTCFFVVTTPRPDAASLLKYYDSARYISHAGKSSVFLDSIYLFARNFTLRWKTKLIKKYISPVSILDYGCGTGEFLNACLSLGLECSGVEPSEGAMVKAISLTKLNIKASLSELEDQEFDVITLWHVLEHIHNLTEKLVEITHHLKENGMLFVAVPNYLSYDADVYGEYWAGFDVPRHLWHFSKRTMEKLFANAGLRLKEIQPMKLDAFYVSLLSQKYKSGSHTPAGILTALINGLVSNWKAKNNTNYSSLIYIATR